MVIHSWSEHQQHLSRAHCFTTYLPYDAKKDLAPVSLISTTAYALTVGSAVPAQTASAFVALAKSNPTYSKYRDGRSGCCNPFGLESGSVMWLKVELKFIHYNTSTPYSDSDLRQISGIFEAVLPVIGNVKSGRLRVLAISGSSRYPQSPAMFQLLLKLDILHTTRWFGLVLLAPAGAPPQIINRMSGSDLHKLQNS
jgi:tripartite-type tricarboxylate transporter receptor subunit TctC